MKRRTFLGASIAASATRLAKAKAPARVRLEEFSYRDVTITGGPLKRQYDHLRAHYLALDNDRLLKVYRQRAGQPAPGEDMGGWYDADGFVPGHTLGQYISGLARYYANTNDPACVEKVRALVNGYTATLGRDGYPYASEKAAITWPCYILDKYEAGLMDAYSLAGMEEARRALVEVIRGATPHIPDHTWDRGPDSPKQAPYDEPYILPENLFNTWQITGDRKYFDMARVYLLDREFFDPLAQNRNILPGKHAYSHAIALSSGARAYEVTGERKYLDAIRNAWDMIEQTQQYASGGWGPKEAFVPPGEGKLGESLTTTRDHFETPCGSYAHTKLARYLLRFTGESRYADGLERIVYNALLASKDPGGDGEYFYYSDYQVGARKEYYKRKWPCCSGTLVQSVADYPLNIYFRGENAIYVALYAPSKVLWRTGGIPVTITQSTKYPEAGEVELRIAVPRSAEFTVYARIPRWASSPVRISVNDKPFSTRTDKGGFAPIRRRWRDGDTVHLNIPIDFRVEPIDDKHPERVAVMRGPVMMVTVNPAGAAGDSAIDLSVKPEAVDYRPSTFRIRTPGESLEMLPFYMVQDETYTTYLRRTV